MRYPEFAVFKAVSARPFRAPCVEVKYCNTESPSRKLEVMGVSMISPEGLAMRPRMPASWRIWSWLPRDPELDIMKMELKLRLLSSRSVFSSLRISCEISRIISRETSLVTLVQTSTTLLYFSVRVMMPSRYWRSMSSTSACAFSSKCTLVVGICRSLTPMVTPAWVANS